MLTSYSRPNVRRRIMMILTTGSLVLGGLAAVSPPAVAKEKYAIDPLTGTKYKPEPEMGQLLMTLAALGGKPLDTLTAIDARLQPTLVDATNAEMKKNSTGTDPGKGDITATDATIVTDDGGELTATVYTPTGPGPFPAVVYFHGGGWVIGSRQMCDLTARALAKEAEVVVIAADYRLAPEHKFPTAWNDALAVYKWASTKVGSWRGDPRRLALAGEGAGGTLAISTAISAVAAGLTRPRAVIAVYPLVQTGTSTESYVDSANAKPLNKATINWYFEKTLTSAADKTDSRFNLLHAKLADLPTVTIINAQIDPLRSDGAMLEEALKQIHRPVLRKEYEGVTHGFFATAPVEPTAKKAQSFAADQLKEAFKE